MDSQRLFGELDDLDQTLPDDQILDRVVHGHLETQSDGCFKTTTFHPGLATLPKSETEQVFDLICFQLQIPYKRKKHWKPFAKRSQEVANLIRKPYVTEEMEEIISSIDDLIEEQTWKQTDLKMRLMISDLYQSRKKRERELGDLIIEEAMKRLKKKRRMI